MKKFLLFRPYYGGKEGFFMLQNHVPSALPQGFSAALAQSPAAMAAFSDLTPELRDHYVARAHYVGSQAEMYRLIEELALNGNHSI